MQTHASLQTLSKHALAFINILMPALLNEGIEPVLIFRDVVQSEESLSRGVFTFAGFE